VTLFTVAEDIAQSGSNDVKTTLRVRCRFSGLTARTAKRSLKHSRNSGKDVGRSQFLGETVLESTVDSLHAAWPGWSRVYPMNLRCLSTATAVDTESVDWPQHIEKELMRHSEGIGVCSVRTDEEPTGKTLSNLLFCVAAADCNALISCAGYPSVQES
jgi:hypothetical protein